MEKETVTTKIAHITTQIYNGKKVYRITKTEVLEDNKIVIRNDFGKKSNPVTRFTQGLMVIYTEGMSYQPFYPTI